MEEKGKSHAAISPSAWFCGLGPQQGKLEQEPRPRTACGHLHNPACTSLLSLSGFRRLTSLCHSSCSYKTGQHSTFTSVSTASWGTLSVPPSTTSMCLVVAFPASRALLWRFLQFGAPLARSILQWRRTLVSLEVCKGKSVFPRAASSTTSTCLCCSSWEHVPPCSLPLSSSSCISSKPERSELDRRPVAFLATAEGCFRHGWR